MNSRTHYDLVVIGSGAAGHRGDSRNKLAKERPSAEHAQYRQGDQFPVREPVGETEMYQDALATSGRGHTTSQCVNPICSRQRERTPSSAPPPTNCRRSPHGFTKGRE